MEVLSHHFWFFLFIAIYGSMVVYLKGAIHRVPKVECLSSPSSPRDDLEKEALNLGFQHIGDFNFSAISSIKTLLRVHLSPDLETAMVLVDITSSKSAFTIIECSTRLKPQGSITTNNSDRPRIFSYPQDKIIVQAPWKKGPAEIWKLHQLLCLAAKDCSHFPAIKRPEEFSKNLVESTRRDYEHQVQAGKMKHMGEDQYRLTLLGSFLSTPRVWWNMNHRHFCFHT